MAKKTSPDRLPELYKAVMTLESEEECRQFFEDLCSESELTAIEQRYQVAKLLLEDKVYLDILLETKASTSTISRVKRMVTGGNGVVRKVLFRLNPELEAKQAAASETADAAQ